MNLLLSVLTLPRLLYALALFSAAMLTTALISQYGFDLHPCDLCIKQRIPYAFIVFLGVAGFILRNKQHVIRWFVYAAIALLFMDAAIAFYHAGVELGIFPGPSGCSGSGKTGLTLEEMRAEILKAPLVTCDQAMIHVLGLSMAAWNAIAAFGAGIASIFALFILRKKT